MESASEDTKASDETDYGGMDNAGDTEESGEVDYGGMDTSSEQKTDNRDKNQNED